LERSIERGSQLSEEQRYRVWQTNTLGVLKAAFGEDSGHVHNFIGQGRLYIAGTPESYLEAQRRKRLAEQIELLEAVIEEFPTLAQTPNIGFDFLAILTPIYGEFRNRFSKMNTAPNPFRQHSKN
jgi:hypothetical protein